MVRNAGLSAAMNLYRAGLQFALNLVLAAFLSPHDFGLIALILPVTLFILLIGDFGLTSAIVRSPTLGRGEAGAAWTICIGFGALLLAGTILLDVLGVFDGLPHPLGGLAVAFAGVVLLTLAAIVPRAMVERRLAYGLISAVETGSSTIGFLFAVVAAKLGAGVWGFAYYHLSMQTVRAIAYAMYARGAAPFSTEWRKALPLMGFGSWVVGFNLVNFVMRNGDRYIIGGMLGTAALGLYALSFQIMLVPLMALTWPVSGVLLATLSRLSDQPALQRSAFVAVLGVAATLTFPTMTFIAVRGGVLFQVLLPHRWDALGAITERMAFAGALQSVTSFSGTIFVVQGRVRGQFVLGVFATAATLALVTLVTWAGGTLLAVADAYLAFTVALSLLYVALMSRMLTLSVAAFAAALAPGVLLSFAGYAAVLAVELLAPGMTPWTHAVVVTLTFAAVGIGLLATQHRRLRAQLATMQGAGQHAAGASGTAGLASVAPNRA